MLRTSYEISLIVSVYKRDIRQNVIN